MAKNRQNSGLSAIARKAEAGAAALPTLLLVGGIITTISIALTASVYLYINSTFGVNLSLRALSVAKSGIYDGIMRVTRDKALTSASYTLVVGNQNAAISICRDAPECGGSGKFKVASIGSAFTRRKKMEAIVSVNSGTGVVKLELMREVAL